MPAPCAAELDDPLVPDALPDEDEFPPSELALPPLELPPPELPPPEVPLPVAPDAVPPPELPLPEFVPNDPLGSEGVETPTPAPAIVVDVEVGAGSCMTVGSVTGSVGTVAVTVGTVGTGTESAGASAARKPRTASRASAATPFTTPQLPRAKFGCGRELGKIAPWGPSPSGTTTRCSA